VWTTASGETREVWIGTSGYSFPDWVGPFYPPRTPSRDFLAHYARRFTCVEINLTHYRIPSPQVLARMLIATPADFRFIVKLHASFTHARTIDGSTRAAFLEAVRPLREAGRLHGLLAQFPWAFRRDAEGKRHLEGLRDAFAGDPLWVEFRHDSWMHPGLASWLAARDLGYCAVDEPALPGLLPPVTHVTNGVGYVRFHGRNATHWWGPRGEQGAPRTGGSREQLRYDHEYRASELEEWLARVRAMAAEAKQTYLFFNNCHAGQAARSAALMEELLQRQARFV
jgi:uncharacterized protein YecE (DUF72 family)